MDLCSCAFTGHRPKSLPWRYNESSPDCTMLKNVLAEQIKTLVDDGVTGFISGMAQGVDLWAAQIVLDLRKKNPAMLREDLFILDIIREDMKNDDPRLQCHISE